MTPPFLTRIADILLGTEPRQRLRITRSLMAANVYLVCVALQAYACVTGFMHWVDAIGLSAIIVVNILSWYGVMRAGLNLRYADPSLTLPQILSALVIIAGAYSITGPVHGAVLMLLTLVLVFGIFNLKAGDARIAGASTVVIMAITCVVKSITEPQYFPIQLEIAHFVLVACIVPTISALAAQLASLRARLQAQKEELTEALERIQILATRDELTGLYNRRHMMDVLMQQQKHLARHGHHRLCVAILDIDLFKRINDGYGHQVGDDVLRGFARALTSQLRETDVVARWGGEEFLVLLTEADLDEAIEGLERVREHLRQTQTVDYLPDLHPTFSAGIALLSSHEPLDHSIERADRALYKAKAGGRNRTLLAEPPMESPVRVGSARNGAESRPPDQAVA
jgi:diguanylate cyclase (GGDEF)-like protein